MNSDTLSSIMKNFITILLVATLSISVGWASGTNDHKRDSLMTLLSVSEGHISDLERSWLLTEVVTPAGNHTNDLWKQLLVEKGVSGNNINDMMNTWLGTLGYTGSLSGRSHGYWAAGGGQTNVLFFTDGNAFEFVTGENFETVD